MSHLRKTLWGGVTLSKYPVKQTSILIFLILVALLLSGAQVSAETSKEKKRKDVRKMAASTLQRLYRAQPGAKRAVEGSAGYAVFSNFGMKIFVAGGGTGKA